MSVDLAENVQTMSREPRHISSTVFILWKKIKEVEKRKGRTEGGR